MVRGMRRVSLFALFLAVVGLVAVACVPPDPPPDCSPTGTVAHHDLRYATSPGVAARSLPDGPGGTDPTTATAPQHRVTSRTADRDERPSPWESSPAADPAEHRPRPRGRRPRGTERTTRPVACRAP